MEAASCLKTWLGCRAMETVVMIGSSLEAWHPSAGGLDIAGLPLGVELGPVGIAKSLRCVKNRVCFEGRL